MLIKALCDYADMQTADNVPEGFSRQTIHYRVILSECGELKDIIPVAQTDGKKKASENIVLPIRTQKSGIESNYIEHRPLYIFGLNYDKDSFTPDDDTNKARKSHAAFVKHELDFFEGLDSPVCTAYRNFVKNWSPENECDNPVLKELGKEYKSTYFGFSLGIGVSDLESDPQFIEKYQKHFSEKNESKADDPVSVCGILGEKLHITRLHEKIKFPGGQTSGCQLVCMNDTAFESYGKTQSYNSSVSEKAMKKYTAMFNELIADSSHHCILGDMVLIYFAMKNGDSAECDIFSSFFADNADKETDEKISTMMKYARSGYTTDEGSINEVKADKDVTFYIAGLTPNAARISQKFIYRGSFGDILDNLMKHQRDLMINKEKNGPVYFSGIARELKSPKSTNEVVSSPLMASVIMSALNNTKYPDALLSTVIRRVKTDSDEDKNHHIKLNDIRAGIIKACLNRKTKKEEITMAWNEDNKEPAYLCGGLFAVYEKIQQLASGGTLNRTIKDAYFASACSRPSSVFPKLAKLSQNHLRKLSDGAEVYYNKIICSITDGLDGGFPSTLSLDDQGRFIVGYYQMNKKINTSSKDE